MDFLSGETTRFVERRVDWADLFRLRGDEIGALDDEVRTLVSVLRSAADVCADLAGAARGAGTSRRGWSRDASSCRRTSPPVTRRCAAPVCCA
ncbi:MAG: hypothetical protein U0802_10935 [Candidatus Binatia bacterium]